MKKIASILYIFHLSVTLMGQGENNVWLFGSASGDNVDSTWLQDTTWGGSNIDFNYEPPRVYYDDDRIWDMNGANTSICDADGNLLFYSSGQIIFGADNEIIEDTFNYSPQWEAWYPTAQGVDIPRGLPIDQSLLTVPFGDSTYFIIYATFDGSEGLTNLLRYTRLDFMDGQPEVIYKDSVLLDIPIWGKGVTACRHANGRDYWMITENFDHTTGHTFLITPEGIAKSHEQPLGYSYPGGGGWARFSPDGSYYGSAISHGPLVDGDITVSLYDFDRCTGMLSNYRRDSLARSVWNLGVGIAYSHDNTKLYFTNDTVIYQYDLEANDIIGSRKVAGYYDGVPFEFPPESGDTQKASLGLLATAPDGRIYISPVATSNRVMHTIERPFADVGNIDLRQKSVQLPTQYIRSMPNHIHLDLGPLYGSGCDTLGIETPPLSKFRYTQDTADYLSISFVENCYYQPTSWSWDFGDGTTSSERFPNHTYVGDGIYEVCLTSTNVYGEDTECKTFQMSTSIHVQESTPLDYYLFPNPAIDYLNLNIDNHFFKEGSYNILSQDGKLHSHGILHNGKNSIDIQNLVSGYYLLSIMDSDVHISSFPFIKE